MGKGKVASINFRDCLYALSDVIINRPKPLRVFDQIYMKLPDMLLQAELISRWFDKKQALFVGDGDAIGLSLMHLASQHLLHGSPEHITVLDFDERVINSVRVFAEDYRLEDRIHAELYNVADALPEKHWQNYDAFYTNPPWGASNDGSSVVSFVERGIEGVRGHALGCIVIGDHRDYPWTHSVQHRAQSLLLQHHFRIAEMVPEFHQYHLDDAPDLQSCSLLVARDNTEVETSYESRPLAPERLENFYGAESPLEIRYIRDMTNGGKLMTRFVLYCESSVVIERIHESAAGRPTVTQFEADFHLQLQACVALTYSIHLGIPAYFLDSAKPVDELVHQVASRLAGAGSV
jgi:predicted methyltransferase